MKRPLLMVCVLAWWSMPVVGGEIAGTLIGEKLTWQSVQQVRDGWVPALWDIPLRLPVASQVIPGGPSSIATTTVTLTGSGGSVTVPITLTGMMYQLASNDGVTMPPTPGTATPSINGTLATLKGQGVGNIAVLLSPTTSPFTHYRPVIKPIIASEWLARFKAAGVPKGEYQGVLSYSAPYNYFRNAPLIRNTLQGELTVKLDYNPAQLNAVTVTGEGVITPSYYGYPERMVGGETRYTITATGVFPNGVRVGLKTPLNSGSRYQLLSQTTTPETGIDYSVTCTSGCIGRTEVIKNGAPVINATTERLTIRSASSSRAEAQMTVSFANKPLSALSSDTYRGSFVLIFEAGM